MASAAKPRTPTVKKPPTVAEKAAALQAKEAARAAARLASEGFEAPQPPSLAKPAAESAAEPEELCERPPVDAAALFLRDGELGFLQGGCFLRFDRQVTLAYSYYFSMIQRSDRSFDASVMKKIGHKLMK